MMPTKEEIEVWKFLQTKDEPTIEELENSIGTWLMLVPGDYRAERLQAGNKIIYTLYLENDFLVKLGINLFDFIPLIEILDKAKSEKLRHILDLPLISLWSILHFRHIRPIPINDVSFWPLWFRVQTLAIFYHLSEIGKKSDQYKLFTEQDFLESNELLRQLIHKIRNRTSGKVELPAKQIAIPEPSEVKELKETIQQLYEKGMTDELMARKAGYSVSTIKRYRKNMGLLKRPRKT